MAEQKKKYTGKIFVTVIADPSRGKKGGFGFIISDPQHKELEYEKIFFHWTALKNETTKFNELKRNDPVEFEVIDLPEKGMRAINIDVLETNGDKDDNRKTTGNLESSEGN